MHRHLGGKGRLKPAMKIPVKKHETIKDTNNIEINSEHHHDGSDQQQLNSMSTNGEVVHDGQNNGE